MAEAIPKIRLLQSADQRLMRFNISKGHMEGLTVANKKVYFSPITIAVWVALTCIFIEYFKWWPDKSFGWMSYLRPLPAFAAMAVPLMFAADWFNRPSFEDSNDKLLHSRDLVDITSYYSRSPASAFWIFENGDKFIGLIAVDASPDSQTQEIISASTAPPVLTKDGHIKYSKGTSSIATIRHFYVMELYRDIEAQDDLLAHAISYTFKADKKVERIEAVSSPMKPYITRALRKQGFRFDRKSDTVGLLKWQTNVWVLERKDWKPVASANST